MVIKEYMVLNSNTTPNGMIARMFGPIEGRRHDAGMLRESGVEQQMQQHMTKANGEIYSVYVDPAYPLYPYVTPPFEKLLYQRIRCVLTIKSQH